jgi:GTPase SAR1 family protein
MKAHEIAESLSVEFRDRSLNEANTRHRIIDPLIHDVLGWPRNRVSCEEYVAPGFADYVLERADGGNILFIEAKKEGEYFHLPHAITGRSLAAYVKVETLLTDGTIKKAITQVREYCLNIGCDVGAITNGHEWIIFKTFQKNEDWRNLKAFVISSLDYFSSRFIEAHNHFSYTSITEKGSLQRLLLDVATSNRELFYPKIKVTNYDAPVDANHYASSLRPIADRYFGVINVEDSEFMDSCYVSDREYDRAFANARRRLEDAITPYLEQYNVRQFKDNDGGGGFGKRLSKNISTTRSTDVVVLFGGKGVGKSTFLRKLLFHKPPQILKKNSIVALIDLLHTSPGTTQIRNAIWNKLIADLDHDNVLSGDRDKLCYLFEDRYQQATRQDLYGLDPSSENYNVSLNKLVSEWKADLPYTAARLANYWRARHKAIIVIVDNTDQFKVELQEDCFSIAQEISVTLSCLVVISMREERFYESSIHGVLDAFQNSGFHITAPEPSQVFLRRIAYVQKLLRSEDESVSASLPSRIDREVTSKLFRVFEREFNARSSHLASFLGACSHGNIRLALELFRGFLVSGYTNVREMTSSDYWTLQIHQVIKPFMIPSRFFYDQQHSQIPNLLQIRSKGHGSHFTALRILSRLCVSQDSKNPPFIPVAKLATEFVETFGMREDFEANMDMLLRHGLIEASNRLDEFDSRVDSVKITAYGEFMLNALSRAFTYIELVCLDCAIADASVSNALTEYANDDYRLYIAHERMERVRQRIEKADIFLRYLEREEEREVELYNIHDYPKIVVPMRKAFDVEKIRVLKSAMKNVGRNSGESRN